MHMPISETESSKYTLSVFLKSLFDLLLLSWRISLISTMLLITKCTEVSAKVKVTKINDSIDIVLAVTRVKNLY